MKFSKKDLRFSLITGFYTGFIAWRIFVFLGVPELGYGSKLCLEDACFWSYHISLAWLTVIVPILWILGVNLGYFLGRWFAFFNQFGKFAAIGFTNAAVDFGVLNFLIFYSGVSVGILFSVFKGISFVVGAVHSYFWNKFWSFEAGKSAVSGQEFFKFFTVTAIAILINVGAASIVVNVIGRQFGFSSEAWANVGAIIGSAIALAVSFIGFKKAVFKK